ncbi:MAG: DUF4340 domain-containing protein [Clostridia bacterium]|nr:DUF4340 domain-containing protein [Clostridia bacterium]
MVLAQTEEVSGVTKKTLITSVILLSVLALLIVGYSVLKNKGTDEANDTSQDTKDTTVYVTSHDASDAVKFSYEKDGVTVSFAKDANGTWHFAEGDDFPLDQTPISNMINAVSRLASSRRVEGGDVSEYGLDNPSLSLFAEFSDGTDVSLAVGIKNEFANGMYLENTATKEVYIVESTFTDVFDKERDDLIKIDTFPLFDTEDVVSMKITDKDGNENVVTDEVSLDDCVSLFTSLTFNNEYLAYSADGGESDFGLSAVNGASAVITYKTTVTVTNEDGTTSDAETESTYTLCFGNKHTVSATGENGEVSEETYVYYTTPGNSIIYSANEAIYEELMRYAAYSAPDSGE